MKLCQERSRLHIRKKFLAQRVVGQGTDSPGKSGHSTKPASIQEVFGQHSEAHSVILGVVLCRARSRTSVILVGPSNQNIL